MSITNSEFEYFKGFFHSEEDCRAHLLKIHWPTGFECPACGHGEYYNVSRRSLLQCRRCSYQTSVLSGTLMHKTRTPLLYWFWGIYWVLKASGTVSAVELSKKLRINYHKARRILHKIYQEDFQKGFCCDLVNSFDSLMVASRENQPINDGFTSEHNFERIFDQSVEQTQNSAKEMISYPAASIKSTLNVPDGRISGMTPEMPVLPDHTILDFQFRTENSIYFKGIQHCDNIPVLIKRIVTENPFFSPIVYLQHECNITKDLKVDGILEPVSLISGDDESFLVFKDFRGGTLKDRLNKGPLELNSFLALATGLTEIIRDLHRLGITHKKINPYSILWNESNLEVRLTGFEEASLLPREEPGFYSTHFTNISFCYISPEQTGRINHTLDYRTDFYSLGATLFEAITGKPPFQSDEPLELIHSHIAREPDVPHELEPSIPEVISGIILKLLSKASEDRYQSSDGLLADLNNCLSQWLNTGLIEKFSLGNLDYTTVFQISQGLYGRMSEISRLLNIFDQVCEGKIQFALITGYAGIGKTSVVKEMHSKITQKGGYFCSDKFDQLKGNTSYSAIISAFAELIRGILSQSDEICKAWRKTIINALGENTQVIIDVLPDLEKLVGPRQAAPDIKGVSIQNRFLTTFMKFVRVFTSKRHPVVLFLDDLHWIDSFSVTLLEAIIKDHEVRYLLIIGAYRSNELDSSPLLQKLLKSLELAGTDTTQVELHPLAQNHLTDLIQDSLHCSVTSASFLANIIRKKTEGNPFFVKHFLTMLHQDNILVFDPDKKAWRWDNGRLDKINITDNVVDLLIARLHTLPAETRHFVSIAACIGGSFDLSTMIYSTGSEPVFVSQHLFPALQAGLVVPTGITPFESGHSVVKLFQNTAFKFQHDRVHQAAYELMDDSRRRELHLQIGWYLYENLDCEYRQKRIFEIVDHLNQAIHLINDPKDRFKLIQMNQTAASKAKFSAAFDLALQYLTAARPLLEKNAWGKNYQLMLAFYQDLFEAACLALKTELIDDLFELVLQNAKTTLDKVGIYQSKYRYHIAVNNPCAAVQIGMEALNMLGITVSDELDHIDMNQIYQQIKSFLRNINLDKILNLPPITNQKDRAIHWFIEHVLVAAFFSNHRTHLKVFLKRLELYENRINPEYSVSFFMGLGSFLCGYFGDTKLGYQIGSLARELDRQEEGRSMQKNVVARFHLHIFHFGQHLADSLTPLMGDFQKSLAQGRFLDATSRLTTHDMNAFLSGRELSSLAPSVARHKAIIVGLNQQVFQWPHEYLHQTVINLIGHADDPCRLSNVDLERLPPTLSSYNTGNEFEIAIFLQYKIFLCCLFNEAREGLKLVNILDSLQKTINYTQAIHTSNCCFAALIRVQCYHEKNSAERAILLEKVLESENKINQWIEQAPMNFHHKLCLIKAERLRVTGEDMKSVVDHYQQAIELARKNRYINDEAMANELAGKYWISQGHPAIGAQFIVQAHNCYTKWGARRKVQQLEGLFPEIINVPDQNFSGFGDTLFSNQPLTDPKSKNLDWNSLIKATQAISSQIEPDLLLDSFLDIVMENVGAQRGFLILVDRKDTKVAIYRDVDTRNKSVKVDLPLADVKNISSRIINQVIQSQQHLVLNNAIKDKQFFEDPYISIHKPKSILCVPVLYRSSMKGALYLENNRIQGAFTLQRIEVIKILITQISISLENARLYSDVKKAESNYRGIFENAQEGIFHSTLEGRFLNANDALAKILGYDSPKSLLKEMTDIGNQLYVDSTKRDELFVELMKKKHAVIEAEVFRKDKKRIWIQFSVRAILDNNGTIKHLEGFTKDITEQKNAMDSLRQSEEHLRKENMRLRSSIKDRFRFGDIIGKSPVMQEVYDVILSAASTDVNVIIFGESGTGKELVAKAIHDASHRKEKAFIPVNCGAIPENLMESEFFGYRKGAFTGAEKSKKGYLDMANQGTLFLDELADINLNIQAKLLRAIEGTGYTPLGSNEIIRSEFRIIAAINADLKEQVKKGKMREDFLYRIHVIPIHLPPLRDRPEDIPLLIEFFMKKFEYYKKIPRIPGQVIDTLVNYSWPGNVRELQNTLHRYIIMEKLDFINLNGENTVEREHIPGIGPSSVNTSLKQAMKAYEKEFLSKTLKQYSWNKNRSAKILGISRRTLYDKIGLYGLGENKNN